MFIKWIVEKLKLNRNGKQAFTKRGSRQSEFWT